MNYIDYINIFAKYLFINLITCYMCFKISNFKTLTTNSKLLVLLTSTMLSAILTFCSKFFNPSSVIILSYIVLSFLYFYITKYKLNYSAIVTFISLAIILMLYMVSIFFTLFICVLIFDTNEQNSIVLIVSMLLQIFTVFLMFKIKRFKNGFSFLKNKDSDYGLVLFLSGIIILIFTELGNFVSKSASEYSLIGLALIFISVFLWIKEKITLHYKSLLTKDTIENLQSQLNEQININENMKNEIKKLSTTNHNISNRISALELYVEKLSNNTTNNESVHSSISEAKKLVKDLSTEFYNEMHINVQNNFLKNKTSIINIDNILEYFQLECTNKNISFNIMVKTDIRNAVNKTISLNYLETLIANMIKNSIIAIGYSSNKNPKILVQFDNTDCFEFRIYDTGIEFEIDTLVNLGKERITTHKDDGGSGIGFVTTFETLEKTNGSFIIEEYPPNNDNFEYAKCLIFRFDNKRNYIIRSYRFEEFNKQANNVFEVKSLLY